MPVSTWFDSNLSLSPVFFFYIQSHKDKSRQKERHKKSSDGLGSSVTSSSIEKV